MRATDADGAQLSMVRPSELRLRYPRVGAYLAALPAGLDSYPECRARSSVAESLVKARPPGAPGAPRPPSVTALFGPCLRSWMPEVRLQATALAIADDARMSDAQFLAWTYDANAAMYRSAAYRAIMTLVSPQLLLQCGAARWNIFHGGTRLTCESEGSGRGVALLTFPPRLFTVLLLRQFAQAFRAALAHSRARESTVDLEDVGETSARFVARWA